MNYQLEPIKEIALFRQLANRIREMILTGQYQYGQKLKRSKELGLELGVNLRVVHKAYKLLIEEGLVEWSRDQGFSVTNNPELHQTRRESLLEDELRLLMKKASDYGLSLQDVLKCAGSCRVHGSESMAE